MSTKSLTSKNPTVSILMPVYNSERYIANALESILAQTFEDFEFIIIDDGSTDNSFAIIESYAQRDSRIRLISRENRGIIATRNELLNESIGQYCAWLDNDDVALPERLSRQVQYMEQHPQCVLLGSRILLIDSVGCPLCEMVDLFTHEQLDNLHIAGVVQIFQTSAMMRREAINKVGGYRDGYELAEDLDLYLRLAEYGQVANLPDVLSKHRQHLSSAGHSKIEKQFRAADAAINSARLRRGLPPFERNHENATYHIAPADHYRKWSWWALNYGNVNTARKYALRAVQQQPFALESWRAMYCSLRGH